MLNDQIAYLWKELNSKREENSRLSPKMNQKMIYVFEFMSSNRSWLDSLGSSEYYISLKSCFSFKSTEKLPIGQYFNLEDLVLLKLHESDDDNKFTLYFIDKYEAYNKQRNFKIRSIVLESTDQIISPLVTNMLKSNQIVFKLNPQNVDQIISLRNVSLIKTLTESEQINFNLFSSVSSTNFDEIYKENTTSLFYVKENENYLVDKFLSLFFVDLASDYDLNEFSFVQLNGKILNICEENCCFDFFCSICKSADLDQDLGSSQLNFDSNNK